MELVLGECKGCEREFGQSEHIFRHEDVHWGPGSSEDTRTVRERGKESGRRQSALVGNGLVRLADEQTL